MSHPHLVERYKPNKSESVGQTLPQLPRSPKAATHYGGYSYKVSYFHSNCGKGCPTDSDLFGLSRSTRCGCCSYQVPSIIMSKYLTILITKSPKQSLETYCFWSAFYYHYYYHYYYVTPNFSRVTCCYSMLHIHYYYSSTHYQKQ
jgi:hypothetical protein